MNTHVVDESAWVFVLYEEAILGAVRAHSFSISALSIGDECLSPHRSPDRCIITEKFSALERGSKNRSNYCC